MSNKDVFKSVYSKKINKDKNYAEILNRIESGSKGHYFRFALIPICLILVICGIVMINNSNFITKDKKTNNNNIIINNIETLGAYRIDADIREIDNIDNTLIDYINVEDLKIPNDLNDISYSAIYGRKNIDIKIYDKLINYQYAYSDTKTKRNIVISFSKENKPVRDYYFSDRGSKQSTINGVKLTIYNYEEVYMTEFIYNNINFDIETSNIKEEELILLLQSIIK